MLLKPGLLDISGVAPVLTLPLILISPSALANSSKHRLPVLSNSPPSSHPPRIITAPSRRAVLGCVVKLSFSTILTPLFGGRTVARVGILDYYQVHVASDRSYPGRRSRRAGRGARLRYLLLALDELYTVTIRVTDEEDAGAAAHGVRLALEVDATGLVELLG